MKSIRLKTYRTKAARAKAIRTALAKAKAKINAKQQLALIKEQIKYHTKTN